MSAMPLLSSFTDEREGRGRERGERYSEPKQENDVKTLINLESGGSLVTTRILPKHKNSSTN